MTPSGPVALLSAALLSVAGCGGPPQPAATAPPAGASADGASADGAPASKASTVARSGSTTTAADDRILDRTFDDIKFDIEPDAPFDRSLLTDPIREMDGHRMRIRGYILPSAQRRLKQFVLVRDNQECCFGPGAALYDCVLVEMRDGEAADYSIRPVAVEGRFTIDEFENPLDPDGPPLAIYRLKGEAVR